MFEGSILAGRCLQNASMGIAHAVAQQLGARSGIPHGLANALVLPAAMAFNAPAAPEAIDLLGRALDVDDPVGAVAGLVEALGLPTRLSDAGVTDDDLDAVVRSVAGSPGAARNPRHLDEDELRELLDGIA